METVKVINPHPRALNLGHNGSGLTLIPGQTYEVEVDDVVKKLIAAGELNEAETKPKPKAAATKTKDDPPPKSQDGAVSGGGKSPSMPETDTPPPAKK